MQPRLFLLSIVNNYTHFTFARHLYACHPFNMNIQENPVQIQKVSRRFKSSVPLFLLHDGGGTILPYCLLGDMRRSVYGIANPHLYDGGRFEGGIEGMAARYAGLIRKTIPKGKVLLGGKSSDSQLNARFL